MLQEIRHCIDHALSGAERETVDTDRFLCLDVSRGRVDGCCCLFFDCEGAGPTVVAKAARSAERQAVYRLDLDNLRALEAAGMNAVHPTTPRALGSCEQRGVLVTLQSALPGRLMRNLPARGLFSPERVAETVERVFSWVSGFQGAFEVRRRVIDETVYEGEVLALVRRVRERYLVGEPEGRFLSRRFEEERRLVGCELPFTVAHGDFCTANLVMRDDGIGAFDWEHPLSHSLPLYDLFFFFSSTRFPFHGLSRESSYAKSLVEVFWGDGYLGRTLRKQVAEECAAHGIPPEVVGDLFVLALLLRADRKYDLFVAAAGLTGEERAASDEAKRRLWRRMRGMDRDAPLYWSRDGVLEGLTYTTRHGVPF